MEIMEIKGITIGYITFLIKKIFYFLIILKILIKKKF